MTSAGVKGEEKQNKTLNQKEREKKKNQENY